MDTSLQALLASAHQRQHVLSRERLMLYAGANLPSAEAQQAYAAGLSAYPAMGLPFHKEQPDTELVSQLEVDTAAAACALFGASWAEVRLPSCTLANLAVFHAFGSPGDLLLAPAAAHGGHLSQRRGGTPELAGLRCAELAYDTSRFQLDAEAAARQVRELRPKLVLLGRSIMLTADTLEPVIEAAREVGALSIFDASHVSGLIAGGVYPNPLDAGVDLMTSSTYKTLPGRPQSLILGRDEQAGAKLAQLLDTRMLANIDPARLASLLVTLRQAGERGADYSARILANSAALAEAWRARGLPIIAPAAGETFTHQLLLPLDADCDARMAMTFLERHGVLIGTCVDPTTAGHSALRLGTQFITTLGLGVADMPVVAGLLADLLLPGAAGRLSIAAESAASKANSQARLRELLAQQDPSAR